MPKRKTSVVWDYFEDIVVEDKRFWRCTLCQELREFTGNTSNLWSHLEKSKEFLHIEAYNNIKDKRQPPRNKKQKTISRPNRLLDGRDTEENEEMGSNATLADEPVPSTSSSVPLPSAIAPSTSDSISPSTSSSTSNSKIKLRNMSC